MSYLPYATYRVSDFDGIERIPQHWQTRKLKHVATLKFSNVDKHSHENEHPIRLCNYTDVYYHDTISSDMKLMKATATALEIHKFRLKKNDVIVTKDSESWDDIAVPAFVSETMEDVICGYHLAQIRPNADDLNGRYLFYCFRTRGIIEQYQIAANGVTRYGLGKYWLDNSLILLPPISEQESITKFLDKKLTEIDITIDEINRLVGDGSNAHTGLLEEYRIALITAAVTGQIDVRGV